MKKKNKMRLLGIGLLVLAVISVILTFVLVSNLTHPAEGEADNGIQEEFEESVNGTLSNVYIVSDQKDEMIILYDQKYYVARQTASAGYTGVADIELSHGRIVKIHSKNNGVTGTLASYSGEEVQLEGYESVRCDESLPVYYVTDSEEPTESVRQISLSDLVIGNSEMELIVTDGMAAAIVTYRTDEVDKIRVLLKNGNEIFYSSLYVKSNSSVSVGEEKVDAKTVISAHTYLKDSVSGKEIRITPQNGGMLFLCDKDGKKKTEGYEGDFILRKAEDGYVLINELPIETYVRYVLPSEMPTGFSYEALKAQAVCARTFAYGQMKGDTYAKYGANLDDSTAYQVYHATTSYEVTDRAVEDTQGMVLTYQNELIDCYYYSTSPGYSENLEVWGTQSPDYLVAENHTKTKTQNLSRKKIFHQFITDQVSSYDMESPYYRWSATLSGKLGMDEKYGRLKSIKINERSESGYVLSLTIVFEEGERTYDKENDIRFALGKYVSQIELADGTVRTDMHSVPSACFEVKSQKDGTIVLTGGGFGHGIGMSQYGADAMGREGKTWQEILTFYYKGASIESVQK